MAKILNDSRLPVNEAALLYCILGSPDPKDKKKRIYPTIKESINYMIGGYTADSEEKRLETIASVTSEQMTLF